jgi:5'-methylthioadenosine phosphorylase
MVRCVTLPFRCAIDNTQQLVRMTERLGIVTGSAFVDALPDNTAEQRLTTDRGAVVLHVGDGFALLRRHGERGQHMPHRLPHHAHVLAFEQLGVRRAVGLASVGALRAGLDPGAAIVPDDYLSMHPPPTFADDDRLHIVPTLDADLRTLLLSVARATDGPVLDSGVYAETRGPRFETRAEIRLLADYADVIGMTAASEATLMQERGIAYALLGIVDNLAHGIGADPLTFERYEAQVERNRVRAHAILDEIVRRCPA